MDVFTRGGSFGPGGYGGGIFDGSQMGFGAYEQAASGISGLTSPTTWTIAPNEWPSTVSQAVVKSATRWKELPAVNPGMKTVTINGQQNLSPWKVGQIVNLPASWTGTTATPASAASIPTNDIAFLTDVINSMLFDLGYAPISASTTKVNAALCGAADFVAKQVKAGNRLLSAPDVSDFTGLAQDYGTLMSALCQPFAPWPVPSKSPAASPPPPPKPPAANPCLVTFGSSGPVVAEMQRTMNVVLAKNGYSQILVSGTWDAATCGAMFALEGEWDPVIGSCPGGWQVPPGCPKGVTPVKPTKTDEPKPDEPKRSNASMAWMVGGLVVAAGVVAVYAASKKR